MTTAERTMRRHLKMLVSTVEEAIRLLDAEMQLPVSVDRGKRIAGICNGPELVKDQAKHFGLGVPLSRSSPLAAKEGQP